MKCLIILLSLLLILIMEPVDCQLRCYSCANCDEGNQEIVQCGLADDYCLKFSMFFLDYVTHKGCAPYCSSGFYSHIFDLSCCSENGCNGATGAINQLTNSLLALPFFFVTPLFVHYFK